tara:strand:- start:385 stop:2892 length:2508 start_codon:yes stop_codon:yes gene_type:complete
MRQNEERCEAFGNDAASVQSLKYMYTAFVQVESMRQGYETGLIDFVPSIRVDPHHTSSLPPEDRAVWADEFDVGVILNNLITHLDDAGAVKQPENGILDSKVWKRSPGGLPGTTALKVSVMPGVYCECIVVMVPLQIPSEDDDGDEVPAWQYDFEAPSDSFIIAALVVITQVEFTRVRKLIVNSTAALVGVQGNHVVQVLPTNEPAQSMPARTLAMVAPYSLRTMYRNQQFGTGGISPPLPMFGRTFDVADGDMRREFARKHTEWESEAREELARGQQEERCQMQNRISGNDKWMRTVLTAKQPEDVARLAQVMGVPTADLWDLAQESQAVTAGTKPMPQLVGRDGKRPVTRRWARSMMQEMRADGYSTSPQVISTVLKGVRLSEKKQKEAGEGLAPSKLSQELEKHTAFLVGQFPALDLALKSLDFVGDVLVTIPPDGMMKQHHTVKELIESARRRFEHKVTEEAWGKFLSLEAEIKEGLKVLKQAADDKKKAAGDAEETRRREAAAQKERDAYAEQVRLVNVALDKSAEAWQRYLDSEHADADACREAITRVKTAKKNIVPILKDDDVELKTRVLAAIEEREKYEKNRKRAQREQAKAEQAEQAEQASSSAPSVPSSPDVEAAPWPPWSAETQPADPPAPTKAERDREKKLARKARKAEQERLAAIDEREATELAEALEQSTVLSAERPPQQRRRNNTIRLAPTTAVNSNGVASQVFTNMLPQPQRLFAPSREAVLQDLDFTVPPPDPVVTPLSAAGPGLASASSPSDRDDPTDLASVATNMACCICFVKARTHLVFPCGHKCVCADCAKKVPIGSPCPLCRGKVGGICEVFE